MQPRQNHYCNNCKKTTEHEIGLATIDLMFEDDSELRYVRCSVCSYMSTCIIENEDDR